MVIHHKCHKGNKNMCVCIEMYGIACASCYGSAGKHLHNYLARKSGKAYVVPVVLVTLPLWLGFLNQARAGHRPVHTWFLKMVSIQTSVCEFVCVSASKASGIIWSPYY